MKMKDMHKHPDAVKTSTADLVKGEAACTTRRGKRYRVYAHENAGMLPMVGHVITAFKAHEVTEAELQQRPGARKRKEKQP